MTLRDQQDPAPENSTPEDVDELVDEWGDESFPASDPPSSIPPTLDENGDGPGSEDPAGPHA